MRIESIFPSVFTLDNVLGTHVRRDALQDGESKVLRVPLSKKGVSPVPRRLIVLPSSQYIVLTIGGTHITLTVGSIENEINYSPLTECVLPTRRKLGKFSPTQHQFVPLAHWFDEFAFPEDCKYGHFVAMRPPPPRTLGRRPFHDQLA